MAEGLPGGQGVGLRCYGDDGDGPGGPVRGHGRSCHRGSPRPCRRGRAVHGRGVLDRVCHGRGAAGGRPSGPRVLLVKSPSAPHRSRRVHGMVRPDGLAESWRTYRRRSSETWSSDSGTYTAYFSRATSVTPLCPSPRPRPRGRRWRFRAGIGKEGWRPSGHDCEGCHRLLAEGRRGGEEDVPCTVFPN